MNRKDPRLRLALQIQQRLSQRSQIPQRDRQRVWSGVEEQVQLVLRRLSRTDSARRRGWHTATRLTESSALDALRNLQYALGNTVAHLERRLEPPDIHLRDLYQELDQLDTE